MIMYPIYVHLRIACAIPNAFNTNNTHWPKSTEFILVSDMSESISLAKWSSLELLPEEDDSPPPAAAQKKSADDSIFSHTYLQRVASER